MRSNGQLSRIVRFLILCIIGPLSIMFFQSPRSWALQQVVYLTFDDGPSKMYTPRILDILHQEHVQATFFVLGFRAQAFPATMRRIRREGHEIGNHGFYHTFLTHKSKSWIQMDVTKADEAITSACGVRPLYYRPPGGILSRKDWNILRSMGHPIAMWSLDTEDWKAQNADTIIQSVKNNIHPGSIILMHDGVSGSRYTVIALPIIIRFLKSAGYSFKTLPTEY